MITVLMSCLVSIWSFSQIQAIQPQKQRFEFIGPHICLDNETGKYDMMINSDNKYEDKAAHLSLGKSIEDVMLSLKNLESAIMVEKSQFSLEGYDIYVAGKGRAVILGTGKLANTAGTYYITDAGIHDDMMAMIDKYNLEYGDVEVIVYSISTSYAMLRIKLTNYGITKLVTLNTSNFNTKLTSFMSGEKDEVLTSEQIEIIAAKIKDGTIRDNKDSQFFLKAIEQK